MHYDQQKVLFNERQYYDLGTAKSSGKCKANLYSDLKQQVLVALQSH